MRGTVSATAPWEVMVDLFFYREPEETKDPAEEEALPPVDAGYGGAAGLPAPQGTGPATSPVVRCMRGAVVVNDRKQG